MADLANAAILASLVVGMVSIPAASGTIETQKSVKDPVSNISSTESLPVQESTELGSDSFKKTVETAFSSFTTTVKSGEVEGELETPQSELVLKKEPGQVEWVLRTPRGRLAVKKTPDMVVHRTETPLGTLREVRENGGLRTSFQGSDREAVEKTAEELRDLMEQKKQDYMEKSDNMRTERYRQGLRLNVSADAPEKVEIRNTLDRTIDLKGWKLANNNPDRFELNQKLKSGQTLHVYSAEKDDEAVEDVTENEDDLYVYDSDLTWENDGDTATLFDSQGNEVESYSY